MNTGINLEFLDNNILIQWLYCFFFIYLIE